MKYNGFLTLLEKTVSFFLKEWDWLVMVIIVF